jgi:hypothetical protein
MRRRAWAVSSMLRRIFDWVFRTDPGTPPSPPPRPPDPEREKYRASDPSTRDAATRYADSLDVVVDAATKNASDQGPAKQLAEDLSGRYGPYTVRWKGSASTRWLWGIDSGTYVLLEGRIFDDDIEPIGDDDKSIGNCRRKFRRDDEGHLVVDNEHLELMKPAQRKGFANALYKELETYYRRSRVDLMTVHATNIGAYTWALKDFNWDPSPVSLDNPVSLTWTFERIRGRIEGLIADAGTHPGDKLLLRQICDRLKEEDLGKGCPTPRELAELPGVDTELGQKVMKGIDWHGIRWLNT